MAYARRVGKSTGKVVAVLPTLANLLPEARVSSRHGMIEGLEWIRWAPGALASAAVLYSAMAGLFVRRRYLAPSPPPRTRWPGVTLLKPLFLDEAGLEENLRSFFEQNYQGPLQIVFGVHSQSDPALRIAEKLRVDYPDRDLAFVVNPNFTGPNPKVANLANMLGHARHEILIASDSDIRVPENYVQTLVAELGEPGIGAVTCLYRGSPRGNIWAILEAMHIDYAFLPNVVFGTSLGLTNPCFGSTIAVRRSTLAEIGGLNAVSSHLADDYEIGRAIRARGYRVSLSSLVVEHICSEAWMTSLVRHELRWAKTIRLLNPAGYAGSVVTHTLPLALLAALTMGLSAPGLSLVMAALTARMWLAWRVRRVVGFQPGPLWLLAFRDMLSFVVFLGSYFGNSVYWRGTRYLTGADGTLAQQ